jgi:hypothetical protein
MDPQPIVASSPETTPQPILSAAQKDAIASATIAVIAVQQAASALAAQGAPRRRPVSSGIFGMPVYDTDVGIPQKPITPTVVPYGAPVVRPVVTQGPGPIVGEGQRIPVGGKIPISRQREQGQTVFSGPRMYQGMYGSSIFGGGIAGLGAMERHRRGGRISGLGDVDTKGFEKGPIVSDDIRPAGQFQPRCGFLGRMIAWDTAWPCNRANQDKALQAQIAWWKANPANQAADSASSNPNGIPPYRKGAWITAMCAGMAPVPPGLPRPSVCQAPAAPPPPTPSPVISSPITGGMPLVQTPGGPAVATTGGGMNTKTLLIIGGLVAAGVGALVLLKGGKKAAAPAAAA